MDTAERELRILSDHDLLNVTWTRHAAGERGADPHVHEHHTDAFYVLAGEMTFGLGPDLERLVVPAGTLVVVPPGVVHSFDNDGPAETRFLNMHAPSGGFVEYLRGRGDFDSHDPPADGGRPASAAVVRGPERLDPDPYAFAIKAELEELSVTLLAFRPGWSGVAPHTHDDLVDAFFVLDGDVEFTLGEREHRVGEGMFVAAPPGVWHGFRPAADARALNLHAPDRGFADRLRRRG